MENQDEEHVQQQLRLFGKRLRELRRLKGFSNLDHFAYHVGVSRNSVGAWENGGNITLENLIKVLKILDMSYIDFFSEGFDEF